MDECIICLTVSSQHQIILNCLHKLCVDCYDRIVSDEKLLQKCPICRHDIFENLNHILYMQMDNVDNGDNEANRAVATANRANTDTIDNIDNFYDIEAFGDFENNSLCTYDHFFTMFKNILLFLFILGISITLIIILGLIAKTLYK